MKRLIVSVIGVLLGIALFQYWNPVMVDRTYQGWLYTHDGAVDEAAEIRLQGYLHRSLISHHRFAGSIVVNAVRIGTIGSSAGNMAMRWHWIRERWRGQSSPTLVGIVNADHLIQLKGGFYLASDLSALSGWLQQVEGLFSEHSVNFAAPATSREDGIAIERRLLGGQ